MKYLVLLLLILVPIIGHAETLTVVIPFDTSLDIAQYVVENATIEWFECIYRCDRVVVSNNRWAGTSGGFGYGHESFVLYARDGDTTVTLELKEEP
jgi:hypothetical protein